MSTQPLHSDKIFSQWTKKYSLSKTLRFELKPFKETKPFLSEFVKSDTQRDKDYKALKKIIDEYHKDHIQEVLSKNDILSLDSLEELIKNVKKLKEAKVIGRGLRAKLKELNTKQKALLERKLSKNIEELKETEKLIKKLQAKLRKQIAERFNKAQKELGESFSEKKQKSDNSKLKKSPLFEKELITKILPAWLKKISWENVQNKEREEFSNKKEFLKWREESLKTVEKFSRFTTYLTGFHKNRKNMYSDKKQSTAISHRIVHENFFRFLSNGESYKKIKGVYPNLTKQFEEIKSNFKAEFDYFKIKSADELFNIRFFNKCLSQEGIDNYNYIIGGKQIEGEKKKSKGINELINLYRQREKSAVSQDQDIKIKFSNKNLPLMQVLYKQILSDRQSHSFYDPEEFKDRKELMLAIREFWKSLFEKEANEKQNTLEKIEELFTEKIFQSDLAGVYFKSSELRSLSQKLFGDYQVIHSAFYDYVESIFSTKKEKKQWLEKDFFSFEEIHVALFDSKREDQEVDISRESLLFSTFFNSKREFSRQGEDKRFSFGEIKKALSSYLEAKKKGVSHSILLFYFQLLKHIKIDSESKKSVLSFCFPSESENKNSGSKKSSTKKNQKTQRLFSILENLYEKIENIPDESPVQPSELNKDDIKSIQIFLKSILEILHLIKPVDLSLVSKKGVEEWDKDMEFYGDFEVLYKKLLSIIKLYNKARNFITKNKRHLEKIKINFENSLLLDGWDVNKESDYLSILLRRKENDKWMYYLGVMNRENRKIFDYQLNFDDYKKDKKKKQKQKLRKEILAEKTNENYYEKMNYKLLPGPKMLPKVFFSIKNIQIFKPSKDIEEIKNKKTYVKGEKFNQKDCHKLIDFYKQSINKHYDWKQFNFKFSPTSQYKDISDFYYELASQGYKLEFDKIKASYIEEKVKNGELYLFQIYNKDFSKHSKGKPNLHTSYFKLLFDEDNLKDVVFKLNGQAELFYRKTSKKKQITHPKNKPIKNKKNPKKTSVFKYDLIKDKRFTEDKFSFHVPIALNFKEKEMKANNFNQEALKFLKDNKDMNIIGIDRGERHLAYWNVINQEGKMLDQGSFNQFTHKYKNKEGQSVELETNYHTLLEKREKERDESRKSWSEIENIKDLKSGYLSQVVHKISQLMIKYKAIVFFEDLNKGFKRGRMKFEKQVYQKLEKALIDKLNYLVFKDKNKKETGGFLKAYQLSSPFESFQKMGQQTGFIFYTPAYYTSKVCPLTGFANLIYPQYKNVKKSQDFFKSFDKIYFNSEANYFVFKYQDDKVNSHRTSESKALWKVCSHGQERYKYDFRNKTHKKINVTQELKKLFEEYNINYKGENNLIEAICEQEEKDFFFKLIDLLKLTLQLRHINPNAETDKERDFILSPVADRKDRFFDSRKAKSNEPQNADANGAYHIALKGLWTLQNIEVDDNNFETSQRKKLRIKPIKNKDWFEFIRYKPFLPKGKKAS